jgi:hypothetical protein
MNDSERLQLQQMINTNNIEDQTETIRKMKHSVLINNDVNSLIFLKNSCHNINELKEKSIVECSFLYKNYTELFNKIIKNEMDFTIFNRFISILKQIENNELDQHTGAFEFGKVLKEMYIDSALKKADKLNENNETVQYLQPSNNLNWRKFKKTKEHKNVKNQLKQLKETENIILNT